MTNKDGEKFREKLAGALLGEDTEPEVIRLTGKTMGDVSAKATTRKKNLEKGYPLKNTKIDARLPREVRETLKDMPNIKSKEEVGEGIKGKVALPGKKSFKKLGALIVDYAMQGPKSLRASGSGEIVAKEK